VSRVDNRDMPWIGSKLMRGKQASDTENAVLRIPLLVIAGPTASGKTEAALRVAEAVPAEIVSADSMQIYRHMDIGTAKPTEAERSRAAFHLVDFVDPRTRYTVADFQADARQAICDIYQRGRLPILCGGTGLYIRAVLEHLQFPPALSEQQEQVRSRLRMEADTLGSQALHRRLAQIDPEAAAGIQPHDARRVVRALEVIHITGRPFSAQQQIDETPPVHYNSQGYILTRPRELLYAGIERRVEQMLAAGWLSEVQALREMGCGLAHQSMQALGYKHLLAYLADQVSYEETVRTIKRDTRRFAKRQLTWFRPLLADTEQDSVELSVPFELLEWADGVQFEKCVQQITRVAAALQQSME